MFKYLMILAIAAAVIYVGYHPEILEQSLSGPSFKVWVDQPFSQSKVTLERSLMVLNVQSREDKPITVKRVLANDDPKCVTTSQPQSFGRDGAARLNASSESVKPL